MHKNAVLFIVVICSVRLCFGQAPSAKALLEGVKKAYESKNEFSVEYSISYIDDESFRTTQTKCVVDVKGDNLRFEQIDQNNKGGYIVIVNKNDAYEYTLGESSVKLFDKEKIASRGVMAFDPRLLVICPGPNLRNTIRSQLNYSKELSYDDGDVQKDEINGIQLWHVTFTNRVGEAHLWIEEPLFRVHRMISKTLFSNAEINAEYDISKKEIFPSKIKIENYTQGKRTICRNYTMEKLELGPIDNEKFSLNSMQLPLNTMIADDRLRQIAGYWNGKELSQDPVQYSHDPAELEKYKRTSPLGNTVRYILMGIGVLLIGCGIFRMVAKKDKTLSA